MQQSDRRLFEMRKIREILALLPDAKELGHADVHRLGDRRHLKFDGNRAQLLNGACGTDATVPDEGGRLAVELLEGIIQRVLQHCAVSVIVFGRDEDEPVKLGQLRRVRALLVTPRCLTGVGMYSTALSH